MNEHQFPEIRTLDDVLPHIEGSDFVVNRQENYTSIVYYTMGKDMFPPITSENDITAKIRRECRGIIFDKDGNILARRFHKFFNLGEREDTTINNFDWSKEHTITEKLDGSMVSPVILNNTLVWMSKAGITDISKQIDHYMVDFTKSNFKDFTLYAKSLGFTPIFEWTSPTQRIILDYQEPKLTLLAMREIYSGMYMPRNVIEHCAETFKLSLVKSYNPKNSLHFLENIKDEKYREGVVVHFEDGHMVKVKTEWYTLLHKTKDIVDRDHDLLVLLLEEKIDDLKALVSGDQLTKVNNFEERVILNIDRFSIAAYNWLHFVRNNGISRKDFAKGTVDSTLLYHTGPVIKNIIFHFWNEPIVTKEMIVDWIRKFLYINSRTASSHKEKCLQIINYGV